jgi:solute carrier family 25 (mitochondrial S-adenosylmethionine transporter), member 26
MASCLVLAPAEVIKQNAQMLKRQDERRELPSSSLQAFRQVAGSGTQGRLWTGYVALVARNVPFTAIQFPIFEFVRGKLWSMRSARRPDAQSRSLVETGLVSGASAGLAGAVAAIITTPSDVVKTRMMLGAASDGGGHGGGSGGGAPSRKGGLAIAQDVFTDKGIRGLFRGGTLRATWTALGSGLYLGTYEMFKAWLARGKHESPMLT